MHFTLYNKLMLSQVVNLTFTTFQPRWLQHTTLNEANKLNLI